MTTATIPTLIGEQKRIYALPLDETVLVKGGAGCGKTTVAVARARQYVHDYADFFTGSPRVLFVSYTRSLVDAVDKMLTGVLERRSMTIKTLHSLAGSLTGVGDTRQLCEGLKREQLINQLSEKPITYDAEFLGDEFSWIKGMLLTTESAYFAKERRGRGNTPRVTQADRAWIWKAYSAYQREMAAHNLKDWDDILLAALSIVSTDGFIPPYTHIVIDEAQDFSLLHLTLISKLVQGRSVTLVADSAQQIYQSGFSWRETGFQVKASSSISLSQNYRNTSEIANVALCLRRKILSVDHETEAVLPPARAIGAKPSLAYCANSNSVLDALQTALADPNIQTVCIAEPNRQRVKQMRGFLEHNNLTPTGLRSETRRGLSVVNLPIYTPHGLIPAPSIVHPQPQKTVFVDTYHAMKGLEFDAVILDNLGESDFGGNALLLGEETVNRNRKLLYVAMTRARHTLHLFASETPTLLLSELDPAMLMLLPPVA